MPTINSKVWPKDRSLPTIAIDMDEVIADVMPKFHDLYCDLFGERCREEDLIGRKIYDLPNAAKIREALHERGFFRDLPPMPGAIEVLDDLRHRANLYFVTAAMEFRNSFEDKYDWIHDHLPWMHWRQLVFCGDKSLIYTDYMIDDHAHNLETFRGKGLLFDALHNRHETRFTRVNDWNEVATFFEKELASHAS